MKKRKLWLILAAASILFAVGCANSAGEDGGIPTPENPIISKLDADKDVGKDGLADTDLNKKTVTVKSGGAVLKNLSNGKIIIDKEVVGEGPITIDGGSGLELTVDANVEIILSSTTELEKLVITNSAKKAKISSAKSELNRSIRAAGGAGLAADGVNEPIIKMFQAESFVNVTVEGGNIYKIESQYDESSKTGAGIITTKDSTAVIRELLHTDKNGKAIENLNLKLDVDEVYTGNGAQIKINDRHPDATIMQVFKVRDGIWEGILWAEDSKWDENREKVKQSIFTYEYLDKGVEYDLVFNYSKRLWIDRNGNVSDETILLNSDSIKVIPAQGTERNFDLKNATISVDNEGNAKWKYDSEPDIPVKQGAYLRYQIFSIGKDEVWRYIGGKNISIKEDGLWKDQNIYKDYEISNANKINEYGTAFLRVDYMHEGFSWNLAQSADFNFREDYYPKVEIKDNILSFTQLPDEKVVPTKADGYYIWLYNGDKGSYIAYKGVPNKDTKIDFNILIESNKALKDAIKADKDRYSFDMAWYHAVEKTAPDGKSTMIDNEYVSSFARRSDLVYTDVEGYEPIECSISGGKIILTKPGKKMLDEYKKIGTNIVLDIHAGDEDVPWHDPKIFPDKSVALTEFDTKENIEFDLEKYLGLAAESISKNGGNYSVSIWLKDDDGIWKSQICPDIEDGFFDTTGYEPPTLKAENGKLKITKPGEKLAKYLKDIDFPYYRLFIRDIDTSVEGYDWNNPKDYVFSVTDYTVDGSTDTEYNRGALPDEIDLLDLIRLSDLPKVKDNKVWVTLSVWDNDKTGGWCAYGGVDTMCVDFSYEGYEPID